MDAYVYAADLLCAPCAEKVREDLKTAPGWTFHAEDPEGDLTGDYWLSPEGHAFNVEGELFHLMQPSGLLRRVGGGDSDTFPSGPHSNGGGEADSPAHCRECGLFLENPLTDYGTTYVLESILEAFQRPAPGDKEARVPFAERTAIKEWLPFYRDGFNRHQKAAVDLLLAVHNVGDRGKYDQEEAVENAASLLLQHKEA